MAKHRSRLKGVLVVFASIVLAVMLCGIFYYFKIKQNESYQNQLHFRELKNLSTDFVNRLKQFQYYAFIRIKQKEVLESKSNTQKVKENQPSPRLTSEIQVSSLSPFSSESDDKIEQKGSPESEYQHIDEIISSYEKQNLKTWPKAIHATELERRRQAKTAELEKKRQAAAKRDEKSKSAYITEQGSTLEHIKTVKVSSKLAAKSYPVLCVDKKKQWSSPKGKKQNTPKRINEQCIDSDYVELENLSQVSGTIDFNDRTINVRYSLGQEEGDFANSIEELSTDGLISITDSPFPLFMIVDESGSIVLSTKNVLENAAVEGIIINNASPIISKLLQKYHSQHLPKQASKEPESESLASIENAIAPIDTIGITGLLDINIANIDYRVFISPLDNPPMSLKKVKVDRATDNKLGQLYAIGLREKSKLTQAKLSISYTIVGFGILCFLAVIAFIPLLKIRLVSTSQAFTLMDRHLAALGLFMLVTILSISGYHYFNYEKQRGEVVKTSKSIFVQMRHNFANEIAELSTYAIDQLSSENELNKYKNNLFSELPDSKENGHHNWFLEHLFYLTGNGKLGRSDKYLFDDIAFWSSYKLERDSPDISLRNREYVKRAFELNLWQAGKFTMSEEDSDILSAKGSLDMCLNKLQNGLFIERLHNLRDTRLSTQFSLSCIRKYANENFEKDKDKDKEQDVVDVISFGTKLQTFFQAVLPENFHYAVFDNISGQVLFHTNDYRKSLVENFYVETDNNHAIKQITYGPLNQRSPVTIDAYYNGDSKVMTVGELYSGIPWSLVIYYDKTALRNINILSLVISIILSLVMLVAFYLLSLLINKHTRRHFFWPHHLEQGHPLIKYRSIALISLIAVFFIICVASLSHHIYSHIGWRLSQHNEASLAKRVNQSFEQVVKYRKENISKYLEDPKTFAEENKTSIPCYLGKSIHQEKCSAYVSETNNNNIEKAALPKRFQLGLTSIVDALLRYSMLQEKIDNQLMNHHSLQQVSWQQSDISSLAEYQMTSQKTLEKALDYPTSSNWSMILTLLAVAFLIICCFKVIIINWCLERLIGIHIPRHFRQRNTNVDNFIAHVSKGYFSSQSHAQVIRTTEFQRHKILNDPNIKKKLRPIGDTIINIGNLYQSPMLDYLKNQNASNEGVSISIDSTHKPLLTQEYVKNDAANKAIEELFLKYHVILPLKHKRTLYVSGLEVLANDPEKRLFALNIIEQLANIPQMNVILFCELSPLYKLTKQLEYPHQEGVRPAEVSEVIRWSQLLSQFKKIYHWSASAKCYMGEADELSSFQTLINETRAWPELLEIFKDFCNYYRHVNKQQINRIQTTKLCLNFTKAVDGSMNKELATFWRPNQIVEYFSSHAGALYHQRWQLCTQAERLLLFQIANNYEPNPLNIAPIEHLARRGYIYQDCGWHIINESFRQFVLTAEPREVMERWIDEANENIWRYLRIPFFALLIAMLAIMVYSATDAIETAIGVLTGILGLIPLAIRNFTLFKGGS